MGRINKKGAMDWFQFSLKEEREHRAQVRAALGAPTPDTCPLGYKYEEISDGSIELLAQPKRPDREPVAPDRQFDNDDEDEVIEAIRAMGLPDGTLLAEPLPEFRHFDRYEAMADAACIPDDFDSEAEAMRLVAKAKQSMVMAERFRQMIFEEAALELEQFEREEQRLGQSDDLGEYPYPDDGYDPRSLGELDDFDELGEMENLDGFDDMSPPREFVSMSELAGNRCGEYDYYDDEAEYEYDVDFFDYYCYDDVVDYESKIDGLPRKQLALLDSPLREASVKAVKSVQYDLRHYSGYKNNVRKKTEDGNVLRFHKHPSWKRRKVEAQFARHSFGSRHTHQPPRLPSPGFIAEIERMARV